MFLNPLAPVTDYQSMLSRIFWFTSAAALVSTWMLRQNIPELDRLLTDVDFTVEFGGNKVLPIAGGYLFPAITVGMLARIYRLHGHVSNWLGIRECFDIEVIIAELASQLDIDLSDVDESELVTYRHHIMRTAFYPFVSSSRPAIDEQLIQQALDAWSWMWVCVETTCVFLLAGLALISGGVLELGLQIMGGAIVLALIGIPSMRNQCKRYAIAQVRAIVADADRAEAARAAFNDLADDPYDDEYTHRLAA